MKQPLNKRKNNESSRQSKKQKISESSKKSINEYFDYLYFDYLHKTILTSNSPLEAAEKLLISEMNLFNFLNEINIQYIELKILNEVILAEIIGNFYYRQKLIKNKKYDLFKFVLQEIYYQLNETKIANFLSTNKLNCILNVYVSKFLYNGQILTLNQLLNEANFDIDFIQKYERIPSDYPSIAEIHYLIFNNSKLTLCAAARILNKERQSIKTRLAANLYEGIPLTFEKLKELSAEQAFNAWSDAYYKPMVKLPRISEHENLELEFTFEQIHSIISNSKSLADAASRLGLGRSTFPNYLKHNNVSFFELIFLTPEEIKGNWI